MTASPCRIGLVLFDFGGVLALEGFREGLKEIAYENGLDPEEFARKGRELVHSTGYVTGKAGENTYWNVLRRETGITGSDQELRSRVLSRFVPRPEMIEIASRLRKHGLPAAVLSDQTNWLDELDQKYHFSHLFKEIFNSFHMGISKKDPEIFTSVCEKMGMGPSDTLFVDDTPDNTDRARSQGLHALVFRNVPQFKDDFSDYCPGLQT